MTLGRRMRLWNAVVEHASGGQVDVVDVCVAAMAAAGVDDAAIVVALPGQRRETIYVSGPAGSDTEELMDTVGEGPGVDALMNGPVLVADLASPDSLRRWPVFAPSAAQGGVRAMFGLPLQVGAVRMGVMDLYRAEPGGLDPDQLADALILAETICTLLLDVASVGGSAGSSDRWFEHTGPHHPEVHQATGMITVQLGVNVTVALVRLRAHAFAHDRRLRDVAADVVARRLRFEPEWGRKTDRPFDEGD